MNSKQGLESLKPWMRQEAVKWPLEDHEEAKV